MFSNSRPKVSNKVSNKNSNYKAKAMEMYKGSNKIIVALVGFIVLLIIGLLIYLIYKAITKAKNPKFISEIPTEFPEIKYSSLIPGNPARKTTITHAIAAIMRKVLPPHARPINQIPSAVARRTKTNPKGTSDACKKTEPAPNPAPIIIE